MALASDRERVAQLDVVLIVVVVARVGSAEVHDTRNHNAGTE